MPGSTQIGRIIDKLKKNNLPDEAIRALIQLNSWEPFLDNPTTV